MISERTRRESNPSPRLLDSGRTTEGDPKHEKRSKRVLASLAAYAFLYEPQTADEVIALPIKIGG